LIDEFDLLINQCVDAFNQDRAWKTGRDLAFGALTCMGKHTLTGMLTASGQQFMDWSSAYRLFSQQRVDISKLFDVARCGVLQELGQQQMIVAHMDDTLLKKPAGTFLAQLGAEIHWGHTFKPILFGDNVFCKSLWRSRIIRDALSPEPYRSIFITVLQQKNHVKKMVKRTGKTIENNNEN
jgi:hypothetical protein